MCDELTNIYERMWDSKNGYISITGGPWPETRVHINVPDQKFAVAGWHIQRCPGLVIISQAWVTPQMRDIGFGKFLAKFRVEAFREMKSSDCEDIEMICRVAPENEKQHHILREVGWTQLTDTLWSVK